MDGVLVDSEKLWKQAEFEIFSSLGVDVKEKDSNQTKTMTTTEVTEFWYQKYPWKSKTLEEVENLVVQRVIQLINEKDCQILGVKEFIRKLKSNDYKIALATNSPSSIIPHVLNKLRVSHLFDVISSAEYESKGKPHPAIYINTAAKLGIPTSNCIAVEDSPTGMQSAKQAGMKVIAFTNGNEDLKFTIADYTISTFSGFVINF